MNCDLIFAGVAMAQGVAWVFALMGFASLCRAGADYLKSRINRS